MNKGSSLRLPLWGGKGEEGILKKIILKKEKANFILHTSSIG